MAEHTIQVTPTQRLRMSCDGNYAEILIGDENDETREWCSQCGATLTLTLTVTPPTNTEKE